MAPLHIPPPPHPGDRHFHVFLVNMLCWFVLPVCFTHGLALLSHHFTSSTRVCSVIFSLQRRCMGVLCCYFRPKMFSPGDHVRYHSRTLGAHVLATVVGPSPNGPQFCHIWYIRPGGVTPVEHESAQLSRPEAVAPECEEKWIPKDLVPPKKPVAAPKARGKAAPQPRAKPAAKRLVWLCKWVLKCNRSKCVILVPRRSLPSL